MSLPQIQFQLGGRPVVLAGTTGTLVNGRSIARACRPVLATTFSNSLDVLQPSSIGGNLVFSMSAGNASLGHACVSPASSDGQFEPIGSDDVQNLFAGSANGHG